MKILKYMVDVAVGDDADADIPGLGHAIELILVEQIRQVKAAEVHPVEAWGVAAPAPNRDDTTTSGSRGPSKARIENGGEPRKKRKYVRKAPAPNRDDVTQVPTKRGRKPASWVKDADAGTVVERRGNVPAGANARDGEGL